MVERTQAKNRRVEESLTGEATLPTSTRHRIALSRTTRMLHRNHVFSSQMLLRERRKTERKARSLQHLKDPRLVNARVGAGKVCEQNAAIFGHASTMRKAAVSPSDRRCPSLDVA